MGSSDVIMTLVYISGYAGRNDVKIHNTCFYYEIYVNYLKDMNRVNWQSAITSYFMK